MSEKVRAKVIENLDNRISPFVNETDDPVEIVIRHLDEGKEFGAECNSQHERVCKYIFYQIAQGMLHMHEEGRIANRDIKPDNMLFITQDGGTDRKGDRAQIADFTTAVGIPKDNLDFKVSD
jgi:serine/threonine protein kinase